jgi:multisubunit Na+/H+ antiporter MnhG subunit
MNLTCLSMVFAESGVVEWAYIRSIAAVMGVCIIGSLIGYVLHRGTHRQGPNQRLQLTGDARDVL